MNANNVVEGYRARYDADDGGRVEVYAVRFDAPKLTIRAAMRRLDPLNSGPPRIIFGATAVHVGLVHGRPRRGTVPSAEDCYRAVRDFIAGLK